jgi:hypothetical protein
MVSIRYFNVFQGIIRIVPDETYIHIGESSLSGTLIDIIRQQCGRPVKFQAIPEVAAVIL